MAIEPDFTAFARAYEEGRPQAVYTRRVADLDTPVSAYLKLAEGRDNAVQAWWIMLFPGIAISLATLGMNLLGDGLRDVLDPRLKVET